MNARSDIMILKVNTQGSDYIIGDVHGAIKAFTSLVNSLGEHDRLMLVGDLTDRGENSEAVLDMVIEANKKSPGKINVVRGNHEDMLLEYLEERIEYLENSESGESASNQGEVINRWTEISRKYEDFGGGWLINNNNISIEKLRSYRDYLNSLPYIMYVDDENPYYIVHADMPLNDADFAKRIQENRGLRGREIEHATCMRPDSIIIANVGRTEDSTPAYCGHTILAGMRASSNSINLDIGSFYTGCLMVVNHQKKTVALHSEFHENLDQETKDKVNAAIKQAENNLQKAINVGVKERNNKRYEELQAKLQAELQSLEAKFLMSSYRHQFNSKKDEVAAVVADKNQPVFVKIRSLEALQQKIENIKKEFDTKQNEIDEFKDLFEKYLNDLAKHPEKAFQDLVKYQMQSIKTYTMIYTQDFQLEELKRLKLDCEKSVNNINTSLQKIENSKANALVEDKSALTNDFKNKLEQSMDRLAIAYGESFRDMADMIRKAIAECLAKTISEKEKLQQLTQLYALWERKVAEYQPLISEMDKLRNELHAQAHQWLATGAEPLSTMGKDIQNRIISTLTNEELGISGKISALKDVTKISKIYKLIYEIETIDSAYEKQYQKKLSIKTKNENIAPVVMLAKATQEKINEGIQSYDDLFGQLQRALENCKEKIRTRPLGLFGKSEKKQTIERLTSVIGSVQSRNSLK
jgi:hypothetical protein